MRQKRVKSYRKVMQLYCSAFKFREPYQLLVDAAFLQSCVQQKLDTMARLQDVLQGTVKPMITQCSIQKLYELGKEAQGAVDLAKEFERRKCNHFKARPEDDCLTSMAGTDNPNRYVVATQSLELRKKLRAVPGLPLVYISRSVMLLESPSDQTLAKKIRMEREKLHVPAAELALLRGAPVASSDSSNVIGDAPASDGAAAEGQDTAEEPAAEPVKKKKRKGPKGPNPLSVKKKAKAGKDETTEAASKKRAREDEAEGRAEQKRKRLADEQTKVMSMAKRGEARDGEQQKKKRKRSKKKKMGAGEGTAGGSEVAAE